jgi:HEAT repeat protein
VDAKSTFVKRFGDLVVLLRVDPGNDAAQDLALTAACAAVEAEAIEVEAGLAWSVIPEDLSLKGRLLARQVETVRVAAGAEPHELLALARALSHDAVAIPSCSNVLVTMVEPLISPAEASTASVPGPSAASPPMSGRADERRTRDERRRSGSGRHPASERRRGPDRREIGERRLHVIRGQQAEIAGLQETISRGARGLAWDAVLGAAAALVRLAPRVPSAERRTFGIRVRRAIPRRVMEALVDLAERDPAVRGPVADVLRWIGVAAAECMLERLVQGEAVGIRGFYYDVLGTLHAAFPLVTPLLTSEHPYEIRHGAALLALLGEPAGIPQLVPLMTHRDETVRIAGVRAIGEIHEGAAADPLRRALHHPDGRTRAAAAEAIARWRGGVLAVLLVPALATERDRDAWYALVSALGRIGAPEACAALAGVAVTRRNVLLRRGYSTGQRLAAIEALGQAGTDAARGTLERLARDADGVVRYAADRLVQARRQRAG